MINSIFKRILLKIYNFGYFLYPSHLGVPEPNIPLIVKTLEGQFSGGILLDIGSCSAPYKRYFDKFKLHYLCMDIIANPEYKIDIIADICHTSVKESSVILVTLFQVLEHLHSPKEALKECYRILKPQGFLIITAPQYWHIHRWPGDYYRYTDEGIRYLCQEAGFQVYKIWPMGGPGILISLVIVNNFDLNGDPLRRVFLAVPLTWFCLFLDKIFFKNNIKRKNPDTTGWVIIARKNEDIND